MPTSPTSAPHERAASLDLTTQARLVSGRDSWRTEAVDSVGLEPMLMTDGPHGIRLESDEANGGLAGLPATCFPTAVSLASTFDTDLVTEVGGAIAREARAHDIGLVLGPGLNIKRHPRCGRNFEYFSEDPYVSGEMAAAMVRGMQARGVGATLKHFAVNNQETMRFVVDAIVDERTLHEIYLAGFEHAIAHTRPWAVMCSYNRLNGEFCSEHRWLLTEVLREQWGFDGLVVSDWGAVNDRPAGVAAGLDLEMPGNKGLNDESIRLAVDQGSLAADDLTRASARVIAMVDRAAAGAQVPTCPLDLDEHHRLARRAAAAGCVLLTNRGGLPLAPSHRSIAVIGEFATRPRFQGGGSSQITPTRIARPLDEIAALAGDAAVHYAPGYHLNGPSDPSLVDEAVSAATAADVAIVFVGLPHGDEAETFDRDHLRLPGEHDDLVRAVCDANPTTVVVLFNGSAVTIPWADKPAAIVAAHLGGQAVGGGVADVLFGVVNPSGRLTETYAHHASDYGSRPWFPGTGRQVQYREGLYVGYRWFDSTGTEPRFCFGHGLSYSDFDYRDLEIFEPDHQVGDVTVRFNLANTSDRDGAEVSQVYVRKQGGVVHAPFQALRGFSKSTVAAGTSTLVEITLDARSFQYYDVAHGGWRCDPAEYEIAVGASSRDIRLTTTVNRCDVGPAPAPTAADAALAAVSASAVAADDTFRALLGTEIPEPTLRDGFDRNSIFRELEQHPAGRLVVKAALAAANRQFRATDEATRKMVARGLAEMPLRGFAQIAGGVIRWDVVDRVIDTLNATDEWPEQIDAALSQLRERFSGWFE